MPSRLPILYSLIAMFVVGFTAGALVRDSVDSFEMALRVLAWGGDALIFAALVLGLLGMAVAAIYRRLPL